MSLPSCSRTAAVVALLALAACGGSDSTSTTETPAATAAATQPAAPTEAPAPVTTAAPAPVTEAPAGAASISLADTSLGTVLVGADGLTLYMFDPDSAGSPTCVGGCASNWPPSLVDDGTTPTVGEGLDASKLSVVAFPDGGNMLKYGDWPLYYFAGDSAAGDVNGQGQGGVWWVVDATGTPIK